MNAEGISSTSLNSYSKKRYVQYSNFNLNAFVNAPPAIQNFCKTFADIHPMQIGLLPFPKVLADLKAAAL